LNRARIAPKEADTTEQWVAEILDGILYQLQDVTGRIAERLSALLDSLLALQTMAEGVFDQLLETLHGEVEFKRKKKDGGRR